MSEAIDPMFVAEILRARTAGDLVIENDGPGGATLHFTMRTSKVTMHLGAANWAIVEKALQEHAS